MPRSQAAAKRLEAVSEDKNGHKSEEETGVKEPDNKLDAASNEVLDADDPKARIISWRGLDLILPPEIPPVLMFDFVSMENEQGAFALMRMFMTLLDGEQFVQVRNVIGAIKPDEQIEAITELSEAIMGSYGTTEGESEASSDS